MTLDPQATAEKLAEAREWTAGTDRFVRYVAVVTGGFLLALVTGFGLINVHQQNSEQRKVISILHRVQEATDPNSAYSKAAAARSQPIIDSLIACPENHTDRVAASILHSPIPPLKPGCPPDSLGTAP